MCSEDCMRSRDQNEGEVCEKEAQCRDGYDPGPSIAFAEASPPRRSERRKSPHNGSHDSL